MAAPPDHNQDGPSRDVFLQHLAVALADNAALERVKEKRAENRKRAKKIGLIDLPDLDLAIKMADWTPSEIANHFARKFTYLGYMDVDVPAQFDLFGGVTGKVKRAPSFKPAGLYAGLQGEDCKPPANLKGSEQQEWIEGWHEGQGYHVLAMENRSLKAAAAGGESTSTTDAGGGAGGDATVDLEDAIAAKGEGGDQAEGELKPGELDPDEDALTLGLASFDAETLADVTLESYLGPQETLEKARKIVVKDAGEERVLKDAVAAPDEPAPAPAAAVKGAPVKKAGGRKKAGA